ncbi:Mth938-like domain-containing protein [Actinoallomurus sp. NBC_01490]|uniref:Mth938-like domain-containing protein n=1 Tax=Actinoallomurus sp. NBC_01490 TaxID=2903557 RepID=UPI002E3645B8|nr:Mth938-like domain-containing protein [Actinoallomurus sp. NBC_01490]
MATKPLDAARRSPRVLGNSWGRMEVETLGTGRDFILYPGGGRRWDWNETGTHHDPGIQPADVTDLIEHGAAVVVLSRGMECRLGTCPETLDLLRGRNIEVHVEETRKAVELYNHLAASRPVGGLFHSTC